jgi:hypothetical protein
MLSSVFVRYQALSYFSPFPMPQDAGTPCTSPHTTRYLEDTLSLTKRRHDSDGIRTRDH